MVGLLSRASRCYLALALLAACGRIAFEVEPGSGTGDGGGGDTAQAPPTMHVVASSTVDAAGLTNAGNEADGTHLVFVDNTPGKNGDLVVVRVGDNSTTFEVDVSADGGVSWASHVLSPTSTTGINGIGGCQDTVGHAFHVSWLDTGLADQYARLVPTYSGGGDITGFTIAANFGFFDEFSDSPGSRDLAEIVDGSGNHRLVFTGSGRFSGAAGLFKLAVTSVAAGLAPASQNDWTPATATTPAGGDDQLLPNNYTTADVTTTYMSSTSSNVAGGATAPFIVVAGLPTDGKLLAWIVAPGSGDTFTLSAPQTVSSAFGAGDGVRASASLSIASAPSGDVWIAYSEGTGSAPGIHVAKLDKTGALTLDAAPQPTTSPAARHAVIATDASSRPAVLYYDGSTAIVGTLLWNGAWLAPAQVAPVGNAPTAAWSITNVWPIGTDAFGYYRDAGAANPTVFSSIEWK